MNLSSDEKRIQEIRERVKAATPGPWTVSCCEWECDCYGEKLQNCEKNDPEHCEDGRLITGAWVPETKNAEYGDFTDMNDQDAEFTAHAREDIPYLLDQLAESQRREQAAVEDMKSIVDAVREKHCDETCCFACKFDGDFSIMESGNYANECPGFDKDDCFEWRGLQDSLS